MMEDGKIIDLYFRRDEEAIRQTEAAHGHKLYTLAYRILLSREDSEESVSDTYLKAWESIPPTRPVYFFAYLAKICRFEAFGRLDWRNAAKRKAEMVELTAEMELCIPDLSSQLKMESEELGRLLNEFLGTLNEESRKIFMRRYWYTDSIMEIAQRYHLSESNVKTRLFRTRNALKAFLEKEGITV